MRKSRRLKVAAVGLGWVTTHRHIPVMKGLPEIEIVGVIEKKPARAESVAKELNCLHHAMASSLNEVPWLDRVDAVTIGTNPASHFALAKEALEADKHVLTEKPFAMKSSEGRELLELAKSNGLTLGIVHNFQFAPSMKALLSDLESGAFGAVRAVTAFQLGNPRRRLPVWYEQLPFGLFYDESPHLLYLLRRLAPGPLRLLNSSVFPSTSGLKTPACMQAMYAAESPTFGSVPVQLLLNFESPVSEWHVAVQGENFLGDVDIFRDIYVRLPNDEDHSSKTVIRTSLSATAQHWWQHIPCGIKHLTGRMHYGNEEVFGRFARSALESRPLEHIGAEQALEILERQHELLEHSRNLLEKSSS